MSIVSLANAAAARRPDIGPVNAVPDNMSEIAFAAGTPPEDAPPDKKEASAVNTALNVLFGYIPTEVVTLYVAVAAALQPATSPTPLWIAFWCFLLATPLAVWVVYATKLKALKKPLPLAYRAWPVWEMSAGLVAYCAWAFALPNTPFLQFEWYSPALASIGVIFSSTILGLLAPLFQNPLGK